MCQILSKLVNLLPGFCDLSIFQMAAAAILDFIIDIILLAYRVHRAEMHHRSKFRQNLSIR